MNFNKIDKADVKTQLLKETDYKEYYIEKLIQKAKINRWNSYAVEQRYTKVIEFWSSRPRNKKIVK